ncbi:MULTISPECIES: DUF4863 family protein [unclassified Beijerinckia]|uniref:4-hydroxylaminobenzoate lyase n=1 Tax=unclassified Beijerinckia TaxID=2638183 RepID=UPI0008985C58|nr:MULTISPECIES: DUF4863 family protein [unclassified Beijerinckia]MDH7798625.1 hypothetical protein [Beijerinckia sp. GAS462]SED27123.1 protein of unknown function [Beijerinckia sp. 28-YEA-48]
MSSAGMPSTGESQFRATVGQIAEAIGDRPLDADLERFLQSTFPPGETNFDDLEQLVLNGVKEGWLCARTAGGIAYGRAVKPGQEAGTFSVDVVVMDNIAGPHHIHTTGEIGMIMPLTGAPMFDGKPRGWYVYPPGSAHFPTVTGGKACILYLLPEGAIAFTGQKA